MDFKRLNRVRAIYLQISCQLYYLNRPVGWWIGPAKRRVACGVKYAANGGIALLLLLGLLANFTVIGSVDPLGMVPFNSCIARSASKRWSNRMNPTPFDRPILHNKSTHKHIKNIFPNRSAEVCKVCVSLVIDYRPFDSDLR